MSTHPNHDHRKLEHPISRRDLLLQGGAAAFGIAALSLGLSEAGAEEKKAAKRILLFTKSAGFEHSVIKRQGDAIGHAEKIVVDLGKQHGFDVVATKDGRIFDSDDFDGFDAIFFYTSGDLTTTGTDKQPPMSEKGKKRLLDAIAAGKGFIGSHCASDSFHTPGDRRQNQEKPDSYIAMLGGEFISHGPQQKATMWVASPKFPGCEKLGENFVLHEEWYSLKNFAKDLHVILVNETEGMDGNDYERPPFPATWLRTHGKGRVFYTSMGHREDVWTNPIFQGILLGGIAWTLKRIEADTAPNIGKVTPRASEMPPAGQRKKKKGS